MVESKPPNRSPFAPLRERFSRGPTAGAIAVPSMSNSRSQMSTGSPKKFRTYPLPTSTQHMRVSNKATALRELQRGQLAHVDKLRKMKPGIDMRSPKQYPHVQYNAKRMQVSPYPLLAASPLPPPPSAPEACQEHSLRRLPHSSRARWRRSAILRSSGRIRSCSARCTRS